MFMVFHWIYGFPLGSWFSFGSTSGSFPWDDDIMMFFWICVSGYTEEERCAWHKGPGMSGGGKIRVSSPPPPPPPSPPAFMFAEN